LVLPKIKTENKAATKNPPANIISHFLKVIVLNEKYFWGGYVFSEAQPIEHSSITLKTLELPGK